MFLRRFHMLFLIFLYLFMINIYNTLLDNDRAQAIPADIGK